MKTIYAAACLAIFAALMMAAPSAHAAVLSYEALLSGPNESPPNGSPGTGIATVDIDDVAHTMHVHIDFSGLVGTTTASHIHSATGTALSGTAGVATTTPNFSGFPLGVTSGTYDNTLDLTDASSYNPSFVTANGGTTAGAESALRAGIAAQQAYLNIHSSVFGSGEIRGFLVAVPEPSTAVLGVLGCIGVVAWGSRRKRTSR